MSLSSSAPVTTPFENPRPVVKKLLSESQSEGQGATVSQSEHRQARAPEPGPFPHAGRVLSLQAGQIPRPSSPRIRDRHLFWIGCSTEPSPTRTSPDTRAPLGLEMFSVRWRAEGPSALDQPCRQGQDDRAKVPGAAEQGHKPCRERRRGGADHRPGGIRSAVPGVHADANHVHGLHHAPGLAAPPTHTRQVERLRVHYRGRRLVRPGEGGASDRTPLPCTRCRRGRPERVEPVWCAAAVRAGGGAAAGGSRGAAGAVRDEHTRRDPAGHGGLLLWPQRLREGRPVELRLNLILIDLFLLC